MVAAGPFTLESDLLYEPLEALADAAVAKKPDVLILVSSQSFHSSHESLDRLSIPCTLCFVSVQ